MNDSAQALADRAELSTTDRQQADGHRTDGHRTDPNQHATEVAQGERFDFGQNWTRFLSVLSEQRIAGAVASLEAALETSDLRGRRFLDVGSGSGLFSLAARRLGASVHSVDYDPKAVACTQELKRRFFPDDADWQAEEGSALDADYLETLGLFDVVYSWGVLHHTGDLWGALGNMIPLVAPGGKLYVAISNDQGRPSLQWTRFKRAYNRLPKRLKFLALWPAFLRLWGPTVLRDSMKGRPLSSWRSYGGVRGMSPWVDLVDWVGGYPFQVATPEAVFSFFRRKGLTLTQMTTCAGGHGCNEFVFVKQTPAGSSD